MSTKGERILEARKAAGLTQKKLGEACGVSHAAVQQWESGASKSLRPSNLFAVEKATGHSAYWIETGRGDKFGSPNFEKGKQKLHELLSEVKENGPLPYAESVLIPQVDIKASLGAGNGSNEDPEVIDHWAVEKKLLRLDGVESEDAVIVRCEGDSMYPNICDGDLVVVDKGQKAVPWDGVYAIHTDSGIRIKRIKVKLDNTVEIVSDNEDKKRFPAETYNGDDAQNFIRPLGRVVRKFWGRVT